jgi:hypothetical protein
MSSNGLRTGGVAALEAQHSTQWMLVDARRMHLVLRMCRKCR